MKKYKYKKSFTYNKKRYYVYADTQSELLIKMGKKLAELEAGVLVPTAKTTVDAYSHYLFETYRKPKVAEYTYHEYISKLELYICNTIGHMRIQDVRRSDCQKCLNNLEGYATSTIKFIRSTLGYIFRQAVLDDLIQKSPAEGLTLPKGTVTKREAMTDAEEKAFLKVALATHKYDVFLLSYFCGCRPSEARKVKMDDIEKVQGKPLLHIRGTKTAGSDRRVPVPDVLMNHLKDVKGYVGKAPTSEKPQTVDQYQRKWRSLLIDLNVALGCRIIRRTLLDEPRVQENLVAYSLRHTYCTNLAKRNVPITTAQKLMGHASISMTANIYTHVDQDMILDVFEALNEVPDVVPKATDVEI